MTMTERGRAPTSEPSRASLRKDWRATGLIIATRDPRGRENGRKSVLKTIIASLEALGVRVIVAHFGDAETAPKAKGDPKPATSFVALPGPSASELSRSIAASLTTQALSLNECLYRSKAAQDVLTRLARDERVDFVITDMVRTASYGAFLGLPWMCDLDDLLSLRYAAASSDAAALSGIGGGPAAGALELAKGVAAPILKTMLARESSILARREIEIARSATLVSTVSPHEAAHLARLSGRPVASTPMAFAVPDEVTPWLLRPASFVALGGFDYKPNRTSLRWFDRHVAPAFEADAFSLDVVGHVPTRDQRGFSSAIRFLGYVESLSETVQRYRALIVPPLPPGGIKTKMVVAALNGTLLLPHESAAEGMDLRHGHNALVWTDASDLKSHIARVQGLDPALARMATDGFAWARARFADDVVREIWSSHVETLLAAGRIKAQGEAA